jgi:hypothetical protein
VSAPGKYSVIEDPSRYPAGTAERRAWLKARGWGCTPHTAHLPERWKHADYPGMTFSRTGACRVAVGFDPEREKQ